MGTNQNNEPCMIPRKINRYQVPQKLGIKFRIFFNIEVNLVTSTSAHQRQPFLKDSSMSNDGVQGAPCYTITKFGDP